ncbi:hypothetical protein [Thiohalomonas denitrificans]|uniref:Uncharacterized protein n=1 Tax=Thiohalomonas denitrificans TaxID=415747 RepID=A0A1G5QSA9_9GAMM|nr:hypothetical protein [Thiohalomonas denitrificans]SCZ64725.1 hypothetical protein SAMN03097708_02702 [Thiohalomonas denitrificans]
MSEKHSLLFVPAVEEARALYEAAPVDRHFRHQRHNERLLGLVILDGNRAGALIEYSQFQHIDEPAKLYFAVNPEGKLELNNEQVELAINQMYERGQTVRKRNLSMTDSDHKFLTKLGSGNASAGLRVAVEIVKTSKSQYPAFW